MKPITLKDMVSVLQKPGHEIHDSITGAKCNLMHHAIGVAGEMLELQFALENNDKANLMEEAGDLAFFTEGLVIAVNLDLSVEDIINDRPSARGYKSLHHAADALVDMVKKHVMYGKGLDSVAVCVTAEALCFWLSYLLEFHGLSLKEAIAANKQKLSKRYEGFTYSDEAALTRKDKA